MTFEEKIAALKSDIATFEAVQRRIDELIVKDNEGEGRACVVAISVLLREAIMHYEEEIAILKGPEAA